MSKELELIAEAIEDHRWDISSPNERRCVCGVLCESISVHRSEVALSRLSGHGYSIVQLPESDGWLVPAWYTDDFEILTNRTRNEVTVRTTRPQMSVERARQFGLALLAAAAAAEEDQ